MKLSGSVIRLEDCIIIGIPSALNREPGRLARNLKKVVIVHEVDLLDRPMSHYSPIGKEQCRPTKVLAGKSNAQRSGGVLHTAAVIGYTRKHNQLLLVSTFQSDNNSQSNNCL